MKAQNSNVKTLVAPSINEDNFAHDVYYGMNFQRLTDYTVISRTESGAPFSLFCHDTWYLPAFAYKVNDNPNFNFLPFYRNPETLKENVRVFKRILLMKMFGKSQMGSPLRLASAHAHRFALLRASQFCDETKTSAKDLFINPETFKTLLEKLSINSKKNMISMVRMLCSSSELDRGFPIDGSILAIAQASAKQNRRKSKQHPIIPSRILLLKYSQYTSFVEEYLANCEKLERIMHAAAINKNYAKVTSDYTPIKENSLTTHLELTNEGELVSFEDAIAEHQLQYISAKRGWKSFVNIINYISIVSHSARNLIHLFTLMRDHEVQSLETGCLEKAHGWNNEALYMLGITTKVHKKPVPTKWITTKSILDPVKALEHINKTLTPYASKNKNHLFLSVALHPRSTGRPSADGLVKSGSMEHRLEPILITERDIAELESIDPLRNWRDDPRFKIGNPWYVTSHQFRRTMSVFAAQSGLITLTSLKRLLGHLTKVMSQYYTKGCSANNYYFALMNPELAAEMQRAKQEADGAMFIRSAIQSSEHLYGKRGKEIMGSRNDDVWILNPRQATEHNAALGLLAWSDSPLGGCGSTEPCDKRAHGNFFTCPGCPWLIGKKSAMDDTILAMEFDLSELEPGTIEHRAEKQNLDDFVDLCSRIIAKG